jgi:uncharacterized membrane protein YhaH (DUF805 family)
MRFDRLGASDWSPRMKSWLTFLFSARGCIGRGPWWMANMVWLLLLTVAIQIDGQPSNGPVLVTVFLITLWPMIAIHIKRWHDRGLPGFWCFLLLAPVIGIPLTILELGFFGPTRDFTSKYYRGPRSYRERARLMYRIPRLALPTHGMSNSLRFLFSFDGCVSRRNWWLTWGGWLLFAMFVNTLDGDRDEPSTWASMVMLVSFWPLLAVTVKRWHDRGKSGLWLFIGLVPLIGPFWALIELGFLGSTQDYSNPYYHGTDPWAPIPKVVPPVS